MKKRLKSFGFAFRGIFEIVRREANFQIHIAAAIIVIVSGFIFKLNQKEWLIIILTIAFVMVAEMLNSAIERIVDLVHPDRHKLAGRIKDISAGAVLLAALAAVVVGLIIFIPKIENIL